MNVCDKTVSSELSVIESHSPQTGSPLHGYNQRLVLGKLWGANKTQVLSAAIHSPSLKGFCFEVKFT